MAENTITERVTDEMVHAALKAKNPVLYREHLRHPANGVNMQETTEREIRVTREMLEAALRASLPLPAAGQEPVAYVDERAIAWLANARAQTASITTTLGKTKSFERPMALCAAPQPAVAAGWVSSDAQHMHMAWRGALKACGVNEADRDAISEVVLSMLAESAALPPAPSTEGA